MSGDHPADIAVGTRVTFPYGGSRRVGVVSDVQMMPDARGGDSYAYFIEMGSRKIFFQGDGISPAGEGPLPPIDPMDGGTHQRRRGGGRRRR